MKKLIGILALAVGVVGCEGGTVYVSDPYYVPQQTWYDVYGSSCGSLKPRCTYLDSYSDRKAMWHDDPGYSSWKSPTWATVYNTDMGYYEDAYGYFGSSGVFYDYYTGRAINEGETEETRDVLTAVGEREQEIVADAASNLASKYALDAGVALRIARTVNDFNKIATTRARTEADLEDFSQRLYGVSMNDVKAAFEQEDKEAGEKLVKAAADTWQTSPENMKKILVDFYVH